MYLLIHKLTQKYIYDKFYKRADIAQQQQQWQKQN